MKVKFCTHSIVYFLFLAENLKRVAVKPLLYPFIILWVIFKDNFF